uniref:Uncharacterized protein n=1 Tax=Chlamydomonas euryale TaxID=1486919 RepID=A0A7R9VQP7_9CHLO|mmetsp:Transcript_42617/g.127893  ORF Transcript_42617/g.127893 Transcript_42617/m.127893 type:complete len:261 (+) Transcript_42617:2-784(+)
MAKKFAESGLDTAGIRSMQHLFHSVQARLPWPKRYDDFPGGALPQHAVRLLVLPLDASPSLTAVASVVTRDVRAALPPEASVFCNARSNYHVTVFHTSHPTDQRPSPRAPGGGVAAGGAPSRAPTAAELAEEADVVAACVARVASPRLVLDRVVMAASGTLLLTWVDPTGNVAALRESLHAAFPGACTKQARIIHSSLLRVLSDEQLSSDDVRKVNDVCERWTAKLRGRCVSPPLAWWVNETEFSTIVGDRTLMPLRRVA